MLSISKAGLILSVCLSALINISLVSPTSSHHAQSIPDYQSTSTDYHRDRYHDVTNNPHLQWQRQPIENNYGYRDVVPTYVTKTIAGFMDFVTTVDNTVMVFTPQGLPSKTAESTLIVTPTKVLPRFDERPTIGIQGLFEDFQRPNFDQIQPSSVKRTPTNQDEAIPEPVQPLEIEPSRINHHREDAKTITRVASTTLNNNFILIDGQPDVGLVTATGGTLIANGVTTVHTTRVFGTYLNGGNYAQIVQSTAKVFEKDIQPTLASGFAGSVQHVTERPGFGLQVAPEQPNSNRRVPPNNDNLPLESLFDDENSVDENEPPSGPSGPSGTGIASRIQQRIAQKKSTQNDFRARLKSRFDRYKSRTQNEPVDRNIGRGSVSQISLDRTSFGRSAFRSSRERSRSREINSKESRSREQIHSKEDRSGEALEVVDDEEPAQDLIGSRSSKSRFRSRIRPAASRVRPVTIELKQESVEQLLSNSQESRPSFGSRKRNQFRSSVPRRNNNNNAVNSFKLNRPQSFTSRGSSSSQDQQTESSTPRIQFKKFNRFSRPDIRQSLLQKILGKGKGKNTLDPEEAEKIKEEQKTKELLDEEEDSITGTGSIETVDNNNIDQDPLMTTLDASTIFPENREQTSTFLEVATIRSPYSFTFEEEMSTRFITVTRTFTNTFKPTIAPSASQPLFQTETIPAPENILTSSDYSTADLDLSSSIETLPAVILSSSTAATPALRTITETFSSTELKLKTSVVPIVLNGNTKLHTLTQSFYVTQLIEAVKTVPPFEYINPTSAFTDLDNILEEAGSEKREQLLPGELEFSDQDDFGNSGFQEIRVKPPPGFQEDLGLLGNKFSLNNNNNNNAEQDRSPNIQSSLGNQFNNAQNSNPFANFLQNQAQNQASSTATPNLPSFNPLAGFSQEQIQQLALLQFLQNNPALGFGFGLGQPQQQVITSSKPIYKTETMYATSTIPLFLGAKKFFTTLTQAIGITTKTEYEPVLQTVSPGSNSNPFGGLNFNQQPQQFAANRPQAGGVTVTTEAVIKQTTVPSTIYKEIKIRFRNTPTVTTLTSTTMVATQVTEFVTKTVRAQATLAPGAGLSGFGGGFNPLAALLG